jgi:hypothetical protein
LRQNAPYSRLEARGRILTAARPVLGVGVVRRAPGDTMSGMSTEKINLELIAADTDPSLRSSEYQAELKNVASALRGTFAKVSFDMFIQDAIDAPSFLLGGFTIENVKSVVVVLVPALGAWLQGRYGRKVRLKVGDIEAEARNVAEIEKLLKQAEKVRPRITE